MNWIVINVLNHMELFLLIVDRGILSVWFLNHQNCTYSFNMKDISLGTRSLNILTKLALVPEH